MAIEHDLNHAERYMRAVETYNKNDPPVEINQIWSGRGKDGRLVRQIRILAPHPDPELGNGRRRWIYVNVGGYMIKESRGMLGICPEFNLRYVFELET